MRPGDASVAARHSGHGDYRLSFCTADGRFAPADRRQTALSAGIAENARQPLIVAGGGVLYGEATPKRCVLC